MSFYYSVVDEDEDQLFLQPVPSSHPGAFEVTCKAQADAIEFELQGQGHRSECPVPNNPFRAPTGPNPWVLLGEAIVLNQQLVEAEPDPEKKKAYAVKQRRLTQAYFWSV